MRKMYISDAIGSTRNDKGNFIENILYDFYYSQYFQPYLLRKNKLGEQRIGDENDIVMPDLIIKDSNNEPFFVESKSSWVKNFSNDTSFSIRKSLENTYKNFYRKIYPAGRIEYENMIPTIIVFSKVWHDNVRQGKILSYFMRITDLAEARFYIGEDEYGRPVKTLTETDINVCSYDVQEFNFSAKGYNKTLSFKFNDDIMNTNRNVWLAPDENSIVEDIINKFE